MTPYLIAVAVVLVASVIGVWAAHRAGNNLKVEERRRWRSNAGSKAETDADTSRDQGPPSSRKGPRS